ncbi:class I SAM-dependent methyltransferase [Clostridium folliculivorans]|uniref:Methyltransferase n=1 Tax=Clostridium folliculivorans TaxID=2886038 RepID=A0A9W5Y1A4_9CLOT|nr:class I SAM-dependent methyltransferase [Clostridium folliculivorans]GKU24672.1 methyltransferase [Clostridium folliculivorans]GKU30770.1 methyltransferase [Clostridium folliculivorans]
MDNNLNEEIIKTEDDVLDMLDNLLEKRESDWWDKFYLRDISSVPFFSDIPDCNIVSYFERGLLSRGHALDVGCGRGRNSIYLAENGFNVTGIDFSNTSIKIAREKSIEGSLEVTFLCKSIFDFEADNESFDFIYDGGCFHHIKPHRRYRYLSTISKLLKPNGYFAMNCFNLKGGANISDYDVYRQNSMCGGMGFTEYKLKNILEHYFDLLEFEEMKESKDNNIFGKSFLWSVLMKKKS